MWDGEEEGAPLPLPLPCRCRAAAVNRPFTGVRSGGPGLPEGEWQNGKQHGQGKPV